MLLNVVVQALWKFTCSAPMIVAKAQPMIRVASPVGKCWYLQALAIIRARGIRGVIAAGEI
jgi:hypothetical protein